MIKKSLCTWRLQYSIRLISWRWPSQNTFGIWTVLYWTWSSRTHFGVSGDWRGALWTLLVIFCIVIIRCTETFCSPYIIVTSRHPVQDLYVVCVLSYEFSSQFYIHPTCISSVTLFVSAYLVYRIEFLFHGSITLLGPSLLIVDVSRSHSDTPHSVELLWTSARPVAETWQCATLNRARHPCTMWDSNPQS